LCPFSTCPLAFLTACVVTRSRLYAIHGQRLEGHQRHCRDGVTPWSAPFAVSPDGIWRLLSRTRELCR
ncbi:MAG: hypothetical protein V3S24_12555, partial [Candidatus Tectomicrobia bacterium]